MMTPSPFLKSPSEMTIEELEEEVRARDKAWQEGCQALADLRKVRRAMDKAVRRLSQTNYLHNELARAALVWLIQRRAEHKDS